MLGGAGIVAGLATFGLRVIQTIGRRITEMTPTRGFSAEFAAAATILVGSRMGLPLSTTHTLVGSVIGVGFARGIAALDMRIVRTIVLSWIATVPLAAAFSAIIFWVLRTLAGA
jgi:phosphate/sulfate permease